MAYLCKDEQKREAIRAFIDEYFRSNAKSPSVRDIADGTGISRAMVQRYLSSMRESGELSYEGQRGIRTEFSRRMDTATVTVGICGKVSCGAPREVYPEDIDYVSIPKAWVGEGVFYLLEAEGDSMIDVGIAPHDLVIVRRAETCENGEIAVALVDGTETVLKRIYYHPEREAFRLHAENSTYSASERDRYVKNVRIQGIAVKVLKHLK